MSYRSGILGSIAILISTSGLILYLASDHALAQMPHQTMPPPEQSSQFHRIDQPIWLKGIVTASGFGLIGLELWWFRFSKPKSRQNMTHDKLPITIRK